MGGIAFGPQGNNLAFCVLLAEASTVGVCLVAGPLVARGDSGLDAVSADAMVLSPGDTAAAVRPLTIDTLAGDPPWTVAGENSDDCFGASVASAGDVNRDDLAGAVVGAHCYPNGSGQGRFYVCTSVLYADGFESSDTSTWSSSVPFK